MASWARGGSDSRKKADLTPALCGQQDDCAYNWLVNKKAGSVFPNIGLIRPTREKVK